MAADNDRPAPVPYTKLVHLEHILAACPSVLVALSGGVDSSFLLRVAHQVLGKQVTALTTVSPTNPAEDTATAAALARDLSVEHVVIESNELDIPNYAANPSDRCYLCKNQLYAICANEARKRSIDTIVDGVNSDDLFDYRPGLRAAEERGVRHPLVEAGLTKDELRTLSRALGLPTWDKPASPCLSSRFPYGTQITFERLQMVARAEAAIRHLGFHDVRVRFHGEIARIEVGTHELARLTDPELRAIVVREVRAAGFHYVTLDLEGFRSGSLNVGLEKSGAPVRKAGAQPQTGLESEKLGST